MEREQIDPYNLEINYDEQFKDYDFDAEDRPCAYPNDSFAKNLYPPNKNFFNIYGSESNAGGQAFDPDWDSGACTNFMG